MGGPLHVDEIPIDVSLVRGLIRDARPDWAGLDVGPLSSSGSTNALFRLGSDLLVRLPRQPGGSAAIEKEARWLPRLAPHLPVAVPEVVMVGEPALGYPEHWSVVRWIDGEAGDGAVPEYGVEVAEDLTNLLTALRRVPVGDDAVADRALNSYRGEALERFDSVAAAAFDACRDLPGLDIDLDRAQRAWRSAVSLPAAVEPQGGCWLHGDLLAENILLTRGRLAAVVDFGGLAIGDPTVDLIVAWELLDAAAREVFRSRLGVDEATWLRGRAWAVGLAINTLPYYWHTMPNRCARRLSVVRAVLQDLD